MRERQRRRGGVLSQCFGFLVFALCRRVRWHQRQDRRLTRATMKQTSTTPQSTSAMTPTSSSRINSHSGMPDPSLDQTRQNSKIAPILRPKNLLLRREEDRRRRRQAGHLLHQQSFAAALVDRLQRPQKLVESGKSAHFFLLLLRAHLRRPGSWRAPDSRRTRRSRRQHTPRSCRHAVPTQHTRRLAWSHCCPQRCRPHSSSTGSSPWSARVASRSCTRHWCATSVVRRHHTPHCTPNTSRSADTTCKTRRRLPSHTSRTSSNYRFVRAHKNNKVHKKRTKNSLTRRRVLRPRRLSRRWWAFSWSL